jgi:hypothetical protein
VLPFIATPVFMEARLLKMLNTGEAVAVGLVLVLTVDGLLLYRHIQRGAGSYTTLMSDYTTFMLIAVLALVTINILVTIFTLLSARRSVSLIESRVGYSPKSQQQRPVAEQDTGLPQDFHDDQRDPLLAKQDPVLQQKIREFQQEISQARQGARLQQEQDVGFQQEQDAPLQPRIYELEQEVLRLQQEHRQLGEELKKALVTRDEAEQEREKIIEGLESLKQVLQRRNGLP